MSPVPSSWHAGRTSALLVLTLLVAMSITVATPGATFAAPTEEGSPGAAPDRLSKSERLAAELVQRVAEAEQLVSYSGVQFVSAWSAAGTTSTVIEVHHVAGQGTAIRVRGSGSGPAAALLTTGPDDGADGWLGGGPLSLLESNFVLRHTGGGHTAGRQADIVEMVRADRSVAGRFWVDRGTGLLLRRELYDASGRTVRASAFVEVRTGRRAVPSHLPPIATPAVTQKLTMADVRELERAGWACPQQMAGSLTLYDTRRMQTANGDALHLSYSDGLSTVSVFQQEGTIGADGLPGYDRVDGPDGVRYIRSGIPEQVVWSADGVVYSVVADAPPDVVAGVVADLPHAELPDGGVINRLGRGLTRVGSWVNPFA